MLQWQSLFFKVFRSPTIHISSCCLLPIAYCWSPSISCNPQPRIYPVFHTMFNVHHNYAFHKTKMDFFFSNYLYICTIHNAMLCLNLLDSRLNGHMPQRLITGMGKKKIKNIEEKSKAQRMNNHTIIMISALPFAIILLVKSMRYGKMVFCSSASVNIKHHSSNLYFNYYYTHPQNFQKHFHFAHNGNAPWIKTNNTFVGLNFCAPINEIN